MKTLVERIKALEQQSLPIGTIIQAFLTEHKIQEQLGPGWILCDGRNVEGSSYHQLGLGTNVPDCRGRFLRSTGGNASPLGATQEEGTALNGLGAVSAISPFSGKPDYQVDWGNNDWDSSRSPSFHKDWKKITVVQDATGVKSRIDIGSSSEPLVTKFVGVEHTHDVTVIMASSDEETRPKNISVNTFVKVN